MWKSTYSNTFPNLKREDVWKAWIDVQHWPKWQNDIDSCEMIGEFKPGNLFFLKPKGMKPIKIILTEVQKESMFTDCTLFFGAKMYDKHILEDTPEGLKITQMIYVTGFLKFLWIKLIIQDIAKSVPAQIEALVKYVQTTKS